MKITNILTLGLMFLYATSCNKDTIELNHGSNLAENQTISKSIDGGTLLTDTQIEAIGDAHNFYLEKAFENFDYSSDDLIQELYQNFESVSPYDSIPFDPTEFETSTEDNLSTLQDSLSDEAFQIINNAVIASNNIENLSAFTDYITTLESTTRNNISGYEKDIVLVTLCVLRKSAYFWLPQEDGGSGIGYEILQNINLNKKDDHGWLAADGTAAGGGMIGTAVTAALATGPVGWGFLVGVGVGAGIASGWHALTH